jgi:hypothetical protein
LCENQILLARSIDTGPLGQSSTRPGLALYGQAPLNFPRRCFSEVIAGAPG